MLFAASCARKSPAVSWRERIVKHQLEDIGHDLTRAHQPHRRDDHAFLVHLAKRADAGRRAAPDVDMVRQAGHIADQLALVVNRRDQRNIVQVYAAEVRVVGQQRVAGAKLIGAIRLDRARHQLDQRAEVVRLSERLGHGADLPVEKRAREIRARLDVGRVGAAPQRDRHLLGHFEQRVADDLELDRIEPGRRIQSRHRVAPMIVARFSGCCRKWLEICAEYSASIMDCQQSTIDNPDPIC